MISILHFKYFPIDFYGASGKSGRPWMCSNDLDSITTVIFPFSNDLGLLLYHFKSIKFIGTFQYQRFHILAKL